MPCLHHFSLPAHRRPHSQGSGCCMAPRLPAAGCRPAPHRLQAATIDAPETEATSQEEFEGPHIAEASEPEQAGPAGSNGASHGEGMSMEHPDKRALYERFFELLQTDLAPRYQVGDKVFGRVLSVDATGAYIELGQKAPAYCQASDITTCKGVKPSETLLPNMSREFVVSSIFSDGAMMVSLKELEMSLKWKRLKQCADEGVKLTAHVTSSTPNGLLVTLFDVPGFVPNRYVDKTVEAEEMVGQDINVRLLESNEADERLILAQRVVGTRNEGLEIKVGMVLDGTVTTLKPFGAFIDLGLPEDALLHVSQISAERVAKIEEVMKPGDKIKAMVLTYEQARERVNLSTKRLERQPGDMVRNPAAVYAQAEETAREFRKKVEEAEKASKSTDDE